DKGMSNPVELDGVLEGTDDMILTGDILKYLRAPLPGHDQIFHRGGCHIT
ncbi:MAG: hypothetical protein QG555_136, partial [Thermodesulfobacteriota bacterium]|nr:hypothetical protein [Thermodesulfobacteriota bacterium]